MPASQARGDATLPLRFASRTYPFVCFASGSILQIQYASARKAYLKKLSKAYAEYAPLRDVMKERNLLSVFARIKFDKEHRSEIDRFPKADEKLHALMDESTKITPKAWAKEIEKIGSELASLRTEYTMEVTGLATAEVIEFSRTELQRECQIDRGQAYIQGIKAKDAPVPQAGSFRDLLAEKAHEAQMRNLEKSMAGQMRHKKYRGHDDR